MLTSAAMLWTDVRRSKCYQRKTWHWSIQTIKGHRPENKLRLKFSRLKTSLKRVTSPRIIIAYRQRDQGRTKHSLACHAWVSKLMRTTFRQAAHWNQTRWILAPLSHRLQGFLLDEDQLREGNHRKLLGIMLHTRALLFPSIHWDARWSQVVRDPLRRETWTS